MKKLSPNVSIETTFPGVTLGALFLAKGTILVDTPPHPDDARSWRAAVRSHRAGGDLLAVILDPHPDRALGARAMECTIAAHEDTADFMRNRPAIFKGQDVSSGANWEGIPSLGNVRWQMPGITYRDHLILHWDESLVRLEYHPGPAPGATWVHLPKQEILFIGDAVLPNQPPFLAYANLPDWIETLDLLLSKEYRNYTLICSRGGELPYEAIRAQRKLLQNIHKAVERLGKRAATPEATASLIPRLLSNIDFPAAMQGQYTDRLQYGLYNYFLRHYVPDPSEEEGK